MRGDDARSEAAPRRPWCVLGAGLILLLLYAGLSFVNDPKGTLSTDVGGKIATLEVMQQRGTASPDLGYWAAEWDPTARFHGLYFTTVVDGKFVNVTTLPVLELARPLYVWGGYRASLLWSMLGAVAAAFAARAIARRAGGGNRRAWVAFWLAGVGSPLLLYALDLWEHAPGLALMSWGVVAALDAVWKPSRWAALAAGVAFGAAFTMRTEAAAYGFAVVTVACLLLWRRRGVVTAVLSGAAAACGFVALVAANYALEVAIVGAPLRTGRASGTAATAGSDLVLRLKEAAVTTIGLFPDTGMASLIAGVGAVGLLGWAAWRVADDGDRTIARLAVIGAVALFLLRAVDGLGFIPGFVVTAPFSVVGVVLVWDGRAARAGRDAVLMVLAALPLVWLFQFGGGALPQWGGRYVLTTGLVLAAVGVGVSGLLDRWMQVTVACLSVAVAVFGLSWMSVRTHEIGRAADTIGAITVPIVSAQGFWLREVGAVYRPDSEWLSVAGLDDVPAAAATVSDSGGTTFDLLWVPSQWGDTVPTIPGWSPTGNDRVEHWFDIDFRLTRYAHD
jgi:hypothetical protein